MVKGLDLFAAHFKDYTEHFILIGGSACDIHLESKGLTFRRTKDIDIILLVEVLSPAFMQHFWQFIKEGEYTIAEIGEKKRFYRFIKPQVADYPFMIELFARKPETLGLAPEDMYITDIPTGDEASSLSAILLDDVYYDFAMQHCERKGGLLVASEHLLVCLKARAFLNNRERKEKHGHDIQDDDIYKHRRDVFRLVAVLNPEINMPVPDIIRADIERFVAMMAEDADDVLDILKSIKLKADISDIVNTLRKAFRIG